MSVKKPSFLQALSCFIVLLLVTGIGKGIFQLAVQPLLLIAATYVAFLGKYLGYSYQEMEDGVTENFTLSLPVIYIMVTVGIVLGTWVYSGTVPYMIYIGMKLISPEMYLIVAFIITALVSLATGTGWGSVATAGLALIGIAGQMGIPLGLASGAIISGAIFGDKLSPLSDTTIMAPTICEVNIYDHIRHLFWTTIPSAIIGLIVFFIMGQGLTMDASEIMAVESLSNQLSLIYNWSILMLLPAVIIIGGALLKFPPIPLMLLSSVVAVAIGMYFHGFSLPDAFTSSLSGFNVSMITNPEAASAIQDPIVSGLLNRGGIASMMDIVSTIICGYAFAGIMAKIGCLHVILETLAHRIDCRWKLIGFTLLAGIILTFTAGVASIVIIMVGTLMKDAYDDMGLDRLNLSRSIEDSGTQLLCFVPWGATGIYFSDLLGVSVGEYALWCIPCYLCVVFGMIWAITGIGIKYTDKSKATGKA